MSERKERIRKLAKKVSETGWTVKATDEWDSLKINENEVDKKVFISEFDKFMEINWKLWENK